MRARIWLLPAVVLLVAPACSEPAQDNAAPRTTAPPARPTERVTISDETFTLELAATPIYRNRGLMYRTEIARDGGMLFVFPEAFLQSFWMVNCLVDIDIIYLDPSGRVTATHQMTVEEPRRANETDEEYRERMNHYSSRIPAQFVIELAGGTLDRLDVKEGDLIDFDVERLRKLAE